MTYPLFIILAHEFVHSINHIKFYELLIKIPNCSPLDADNEIWENFVKGFYKKENISIDKELSSDQYQHYMYEFLQKDIFKKTFGFSIFENKSDDYCVLSYYCNNNKKDESLAIIGDGSFGDNIFLEEARKYKLLYNYQGFEPGSIFRWGHGFFDFISE